MAAGPEVKAQFNALSSTKQQTIATCNGKLPCNKILFIPWRDQSSNSTNLKKSIDEFVSEVITYASGNRHKTVGEFLKIVSSSNASIYFLAFPSIGCGKLGFDPSIIAKHMISETKKQLTDKNLEMNISFVILSNQRNVYDEFVKYLNTIQEHSMTTSESLEKTKMKYQSKIPYDEKSNISLLFCFCFFIEKFNSLFWFIVVEITLTGSDMNCLKKCTNDIQKLSHFYLFTRRLSNKHDLKHWSQDAINQYYDSCLKQHVIPKFDLDTSLLELVGPKDAVILR